MKIIFTALFLPLGLVLLLLAGSVWAALDYRPQYKPGQRRGWLIGLPLAGLIVLYMAATPVCGRALGLLLINHVQGRVLEDPSSADAVIVLTGGMVRAGQVGWLPKADSIHRLAVAYELQRLVNLRMPVIISGGHTAGVQNPSEAAVVAQFFAKNRTELTPTELEEASLDTYESALQLAPALARREARAVFLVTSDVHMLRALATFRARGIDPMPFPAVQLAEVDGVRGFLPSVAGLAMTTDALYEIYGLTEYLLTGKIGWHDIVYQQG